ncbi:MAG: pyrroline-5-carboxylate reductase [Phyllobacteriaceae bacterium]|nr:pyrroline-5-carboxylate reductase [Phyllobacteriaceae bacterium]
MKVILVGCGNMGFAMLKGWIESGRLAAADVAVVEPNADLRDRAAALGVATAGAAAELGDAAADIVVLAVKPQAMRAVLADWTRLGDGATMFLTVAAGTRIALYEDILGARTPVLRCMPNTPAAIGLGMMVTVGNAHVSAMQKQAAHALLSASGEVAEIADENLMDAVTAVSGSGPAYLFHFIEALTAAAKAVGLPGDIAAKLAMQTAYGAATLAARSADGPARLREQVTSPNGTTAAALGVLMGDGALEKLMTTAVIAARDRGVELGKG